MFTIETNIFGYIVIGVIGIRIIGKLWWENKGRITNRKETTMKTRNFETDPVSEQEVKFSTEHTKFGWYHSVFPEGYAIHALSNGNWELKRKMDGWRFPNVKLELLAQLVAVDANEVAKVLNARSAAIETFNAHEQEEAQ